MLKKVVSCRDRVRVSFCAKLQNRSHGKKDNCFILRSNIGQNA